MEEAKSSKSVTRGAGAPSSSQVDEERKGEAEVAAIPAGKESRAESDEEDITLGPGWMNRSGSRTLTLSGTRDFAKGSSSGVVPIAGGSKLLAYCYTKEDVLALHSAVADECPPDFLALPYILSEEPLLPVNLSQDLLKDFEELQRKYLYNICPSRASSSATRGGTRGRGRGRGRGSDRELRPRDKEGSLSGSSSGSGVYRPPRGRGRLGYSWEGEGERSERSERSERRPAWADTPVDKDAPKGRFSGGRFRGDSDSEGSELEELEDEKAYSDSDEAASEDEAPGVGWLYRDPQNIVRGPFSNKEMHEWYLGGFFPPSLPVKKEGDEDFKALSTYEGNPFARQRKKKEKVVRREKLREMHAADLEGRGERGARGDWGDRAERGGDRGDWRKRSDQKAGAAAEKAPRETPSKRTEEKPKDEGNWRTDNTKDVKVADKKPAAAAPKEAPAKKPEEKTAVTKKAEEIIKAAKEAERAKKEKEEKERQESKKKEAAAAKQPQAAAAAAAAPKPKQQGGAAVKRDSADMSDPESLDDILDHFPRLASELIASSDDEGDERPSPYPAGARPVPHGGWPATAKAPWSAQELEMRQFQQFGGPGGPMPAGDRAPMHGKPPAHPHMHPHPQFPGAPEGKGPFMHPLMGPGQPPQQFFPGLQPGFPPLGALPGMRPGVPAGPPGPHHIPSLERRQGVFDMAAIEEQLMKQSHMPPEMRMHLQQPHVPPHAPHVPPHAAPWLMAPMHGKPGHAPTLREIQEQEMRERQQRQHPMPPQAFPHPFTPEQMLHHHMLSEQHKQQIMRQQLAMGMRPQVDPVFQSVWGISPDGTPLSLQEIQARMQNENEEERRNGGAGVNDSVEQELHDDEQQHRSQHHEERQGGESETDSGSASSEPTRQADDEEDIWDVPATEQAKQQQQATAKADQQQPSKKQTKQQQQQKKKGNQAQQQQSPKQKGGAKAQQQQQTTGRTSGAAKPPSLKEIQEQEQREMLERQKQQKQSKAAAPAQQGGDGKNLQNLLSAWGFSSGESDIDNNNAQQPSWASMDETPSLREIQEQEAAQREMAQMEDQQRKRQQQQQQAQKANEVAWTGGRGTKKPTLAEIQAEELKQQQKRQKEMQHQHKQQLKAQREQLSRFSSPWAGAAQTTESSPLSLREIQELEQRRAQEEANKRRKNAPAGGAEPITKLLWETRVGGNEPVPLSEIMAQEEAATQSDEPKPKKEAAQPQTAQSEDVWSSGSGQHTVSAAQSKASLRDIQQEEQKSGKQQPQQQQQQKKGGKGQQASASGQQEKSSKKQQQSQSPQKGNKKQQQQQQQQFKGVWGAVPSAPKASLLDIQVNQQRAVSPPPAASAQSVSAAPAPAPKSAPAPVVEDDFWGAPETPAAKSGGKGDNGSAPAIIDDSHFPALGGGKSSGANNATKKAGQQQATKKSANWAKTTGATAATASSAASGGRRLASSGSSLPQQAAPKAQAPKPTTPKTQQQQAKASAAAAPNPAAAGKKKMQKLDPSLLGFSSNLHDRIAQGQVLPIDE